MVLIMSDTIIDFYSIIGYSSLLILKDIDLKGIESESSAIKPNL